MQEGGLIKVPTVVLKEAGLKAGDRVTIGCLEEMKVIVIEEQGVVPDPEIPEEGPGRSEEAPGKPQ